MAERQGSSKGSWWGGPRGETEEGRRPAKRGSFIDSIVLGLISDGERERPLVKAGSVRERAARFQQQQNGGSAAAAEVDHFAAPTNGNPTPAALSPGSVRARAQALAAKAASPFPPSLVSRPPTLTQNRGDLEGLISVAERAAELAAAAAASSKESPKAVAAGKRDEREASVGGGRGEEEIRAPSLLQSDTNQGSLQKRPVAQGASSTTLVAAKGAEDVAVARVKRSEQAPMPGTAPLRRRQPSRKSVEEISAAQQEALEAAREIQLAMDLEQKRAEREAGTKMEPREGGSAGAGRAPDATAAAAPPRSAPRARDSPGAGLWVQTPTDRVCGVAQPPESSFKGSSMSLTDSGDAAAAAAPRAAVEAAAVVWKGRKAEAFGSPQKVTGASPSRHAASAHARVASERLSSSSGLAVGAGAAATGRRKPLEETALPAPEEVAGAALTRGVGARRRSSLGATTGAAAQLRARLRAIDSPAALTATPPTDAAAGLAVARALGTRDWKKESAETLGDQRATVRRLRAALDQEEGREEGVGASLSPTERLKAAVRRAKASG